MALADRRWAAPLFLAMASPVLAEILSGNLAPSLFFLPPIFALMLVAYGIPVLLIRDAWVRFRLGVPGLFLLGVAYGFVNEALFAKTLFLDVGVPIDTFDGYRESGVNWAFASFIVPWHALHAVLYPIAFAWWFFPARRDEPWLSPRLSVSLFAVFMLVGALVHAQDDNVQGTLATYLFALVAILIAVLLAFRAPRVPPLLEPGVTRRGVAWLGAATAAFLFLLAVPSDRGLPSLAIVGMAAAFLGGMGWLLHRHGGFHAPGFLRFALGNELAFVLLSMAFDVVAGAWERLVAHALLEALFIVALVRLGREEVRDLAAPA